MAPRLRRAGVRAADGPLGGRGLPSRRRRRAGSGRRARGPGPGALRALDVDGVGAAAGQRRRLAARLPRRVRRVRRAAAATASSTAACCAAPAARSSSTCRAPAAPPAASRSSCTPVPLLETGRAPGGGVSELDAMVAARRRAETVARMRSLARAGPATARDGPVAAGRRRSAATCATRRCPTTTATCCTSSSGGSCARARRAGRFTPATPSTGRPGCGRSGSTEFECDDEIWAAFQIPIGLAFFMRSTVTGVGGRVLPEPGRRDRVRAEPRGVGGARAAPTRCSSSSSPTPRRWSSTACPTRPSTRSRRSTSATRWSG